MPVAVSNDRDGRQPAQRTSVKLADGNGRAAPLSRPSDRNGHDVGRTSSIRAVPPFVGWQQSGTGRAMLALLAFFGVFALCTNLVKSWSIDGILEGLTSLHTVSHYTRAVPSSLLETFQVYPPILAVTPDGVLEITDGSSNATVKIINSDRPTCQQVLVVHIFAFSYNDPFVGEYTPPACSYNRVSWNLTVVSAGRQFDRLGIVYLGDIEVFRTSTAEPTQDGIEWTYLKDMSNFLSLFRTDQKIIFDLGNLVNEIYTGAFNVTLTASYFTATDSVLPADLIVPISARNSQRNRPSVFMVPPDTASNNLSLPRNIKKAVVTIAATGQSEEEFWWSNVLQSDVEAFPQYGDLYGYSPFREVQLLIDGTLAGVAWPFPNIFTGGVVPGLWRPIVGIDAFDLKEDEIDVTPWLPLLCDGDSHTFSIRVSGLNDSGDGSAVLSETTGSYWWITAKVFIWLDKDGHVTSGDGPFMTMPAPDFQISSSIGKNANGTNQTLMYAINASRMLASRSTINLSHGQEITTWMQRLTFSNTGNFCDRGNVQVNSQNTQSTDISSSGYAKACSYPLYAYTEYRYIGENISIVGHVNCGKDVKIVGDAVFPTGLESFYDSEDSRQNDLGFEGVWLTTNQTGSATYLANETAAKSFGFGQTEQNMFFRGVRLRPPRELREFPAISRSKELFQRQVNAVNTTVIRDEETLLSAPISHVHGLSGQTDAENFVLSRMPPRKWRWSKKGCQ